ncbi:MAG: hypothetical protein JSS81_13075 [Acidobacteria bacterium]|nr:hypothetical protein [Acidobacteriota bacterium]
MKRTVIFLRAGFLSALALLGGLAAQAQTATFTYQGRLTDVNNPSGSGAYDMQDVFTARETHEKHERIYCF